MKKNILQENMRRFGTKNIDEAITISGYQVSANAGKLQIVTPNNKTYAYEMRVKGFSIPIIDLVHTGAEYIMKYKRPSLGFTGVSYSAAESPLNVSQIQSMFSKLGVDELNMDVANADGGRQSVTFRKA
jgi:hypothetical protein